MGTLIAFTVGYVFGSRSGRERYEEVTDAIREIRSSEEFRGLVMAVSSHLEHIVQEVGTRLTTPEAPPEDGERASAPRTPAWAAEWMHGTLDDLTGGNGRRQSSRIRR